MQFISPSATHDGNPPGNSGENEHGAERSSHLLALTPGRAWVIPDIAPCELASRLKAIVICRRDECNLLRKVAPHDPANAFTLGIGLEGQISGLVPLAEITTFHRSGFGRFFEPSANEVAAQIPPELLGKFAAFETVPMDDHVAVCWSEENRMHQAVTTLYAAPNGVVETPVDEGARRAEKILRLKQYVPPTAAELDPRFSTTDRIVITLDGDRQACWKLLAHDRKIPWRQDAQGLDFTLGYHQDLSICADANWETVGDEHVLFLSMDRRAVDLNRLEAWTKANLPTTPTHTVQDFLRLHGLVPGVGTEHRDTVQLLCSADEAQEKLKGVTCFVEAGEAARIEISEDAIMQGYTWKSDPMRLTVSLLSKDGETMNAEFELTTIGGRSIAFFKPGGEILDYEVLNSWLDRTFVNVSGGERVRRSDAMNFSLRDILQ